jgi:hypothetical protein
MTHSVGYRILDLDNFFSVGHLQLKNPKISFISLFTEVTLFSVELLLAHQATI